MKKKTVAPLPSIDPLIGVVPTTLQSLNEKNTSYYNPVPNPDFQPNDTLKSFLKDRRLLMDELPFSLQEVHHHVVNGFVNYEAGIISKMGRSHCQRCGNEDRTLFGAFHCFRCKKRLYLLPELFNDGQGIRLYTFTHLERPQ
ncbi:MAG: hypothetical protein LRY73_11025 [Bacillus sp. (in: Bacteria)]|nr:hypothetical protein [Bacillus sp. (in: firmicutes)]